MNAPLQYEARELSQELAERIEQVVEALHIDVKYRSRSKVYAFAPWAASPKAKLEIELWPVPGKWNDWIGGLYGDAFDLVARTLGQGERDRRAAYRWSLEFLGLKDQRDEDEWRRRREEGAARAKARQEQAARGLARARGAAKAAWLAAKPLTPGDDGWRYLQARGVDLNLLPRSPKGQLLVRAVRFAQAERWHDAEGEVRHVGPALLSAMTLPDGDFGSLHRIWLNPQRPGDKADLSHIAGDAPVRKMWPDAKGCAIRLWRGSSRKSEREAADAGVKEPVAVCEGVEDGLSIALMKPELRICAAGSLPGLTAFVPPACASRVIVAADNDWGKPQAAALLERACARLSTDFSLPVFIARSPEGKDFNDLLRGAA